VLSESAPATRVSDIDADLLIMTTNELRAAADELEQNEYVDRVVRLWTDDDEPLNCLMVRLDWVTESHQENGTRIIESAEYDGHIREVSDAVDALAGVHATRTIDSGLRGYTFFVDEGDA